MTDEEVAAIVIVEKAQQKLIADLNRKLEELQVDADKLEKAAAGYASFLSILVDELEIDTEETTITVKGPDIALSLCAMLKRFGYEIKKVKK